MKIEIHLHHHYHPDSAFVQKLEEIMGKVVSEAVADFAAQMKVYQDQNAQAITGLQQATANLGSDIKTLNDKIDKLQNSTGEISDADQATLDSIQTIAQGSAATLKTVNDALDALDNLTPPATPSAGVEVGQPPA